MTPTYTPEQIRHTAEVNEKCGHTVLPAQLRQGADAVERLRLLSEASHDYLTQLGAKYPNETREQTESRQFNALRDAICKYADAPRAMQANPITETKP
jgi:hypothetical protein